ncbi:MAG: MBOAT family O-acyltransferase [Planctomycetota bacterium]
MIFTQAVFFVFFAVVASIYWLLRGNGTRKAWLLAASYVFYGSWDWRFLGLILISTLVDYVAGIGIEGAADGWRKRLWLYASLAINLGLLGYFKYFNFFVESGVGLLNLFGLELAPMRADIILPVGISFYTFQSLSYSIDIYRGELQARRSPLDFALFVAFFPQLVAGPIVRAVEFLPQLDVRRRLADVEFRACLTLFLFGFIKKACVADRVAPMVDRIFSDPEAVGTTGRWIGAGLFNVQLYCDFSGYSDMAMATAGLLGYRLVENFRFPFFAPSVGEFWRRWHISLTSWIRDYLYIYLDWLWVRLGGNKRSRWRIYTALFGVYTAVGLWHGASWNFVFFGMNAGLFVVLEAAGKMKWITSRGWLAYPYVFLFWTMSAVFFRSGGLDHVVPYVTGMFGAGGPATDPVALRWAAVFPLFLVVHFAMYRRFLHDFFRRLPDWAFAAVYGVAAALVLPWASVGYQAFVYFQF